MHSAIESKDTYLTFAQMTPQPRFEVYKFVEGRAVQFDFGRINLA
jgi:hypothetical protein